MKTNSDKYEQALEYLDVEPDGTVWRKERTWISGKGAVRHLPKQKVIPYINRKKGYLMVEIRIDGKRYRPLVHRLVATALIPKPEGWDETWQVNHKNGIKTDCSVSNLEWCTAKDNSIHAWKTGLSKLNSGNYQTSPVEQFDLTSGEVIGTYSSQSEAARAVGCTQSNIYACCKGKTHQAFGFGWRYA